ncbi:MAG: AAA family ATPase [Cyclobacteriaceae bacterium]|nr:AAA family ATPase [Cyclobacteriaceae bacterium]
MGDTSKHLTYFRVENFKRFESFEMKDLGQFNLIVGDNNVGKTSVLEALLVDEDPYNYTTKLFAALDFRNIKDRLNYRDLSLFANRDLSVNKSLYSFNFKLIYNDSSVKEFLVEFKNGQQLVFNGFVNPNLVINLYENFGFNPSVNIPFIPFYKGHDSDLTNFYSRLQNSKSLKKSFIKSLNTIVPDLEEIELSSPYADSGPHLIVYQKNNESSLPLAMFGDGTIKLFRLLAEIILNKGNRLMIDEVDTGIYFNRFKQFWKVILQTAKENDVQLFMTTHNEECINYFKEVLEDELIDLQSDTRCITLIENSKTKQVTAHTYNFEQFEHAINLGNEIRA